MSHATSALPGGVVLDWSHARTGPPEPCVFGDGLTVCRSPVKDVPCHKGCAEAWITTHAADAADVPGSSAPTPPGRCAMSDFRVIYHAQVCPDCGSFDITDDEVETIDGFTETAFTCQACGAAWPLACIAEQLPAPGPAARPHLALRIDGCTPDAELADRRYWCPSCDTYLTGTDLAGQPAPHYTPGPDRVITPADLRPALTPSNPTRR